MRRIRPTMTAIATSLLIAVATVITPAAQAAGTGLLAAEARAAEFQRLGFTDDVTTQIDSISAADPAAGERWRKLSAFWTDSVLNFTVHGASDPASPSGIPDGIPDVRSHVFVVLGLALNADGTPQAGLVDRLKVAKAAADKYPSTRIVVTGGQAKNGITESQAMRTWLIGQGVDSSRIVSESASADTPDNATLTMDILYELSGADAVTSYTVISSASHVRRAGILYYFASLEEQARHSGAAFIAPIAHAAALDVTDAAKYPTADERELITQNVVKIAGVATQFNAFRARLRTATAKVIYFQRAGVAADALRAADELGELSHEAGSAWRAVLPQWQAVLSPLAIHSSVPTDLPTQKHSFVLMGSNDSRTDTRLALAKEALTRYPNSVVVLTGNSTEISISAAWLANNGIDSVRVIQARAGDNASQGAVNALDVLYGLRGEVTSYTLITSGNYLRRPLALFSAANQARRAAWGAATPLTMVSHLAEVAAGGSGDASAPTDANVRQIADNIASIYESTTQFYAFESEPPTSSVLIGIEVTTTGPTKQFAYGQFDATGLAVSAILDDGDRRTVDISGLVTVTSPSLEHVGVATVDIAYMHDGVVKTASYDITVLDPAPAVAIELSVAAQDGWLQSGTTASVIAIARTPGSTISDIEYSTGEGWKPYTEPIVLPKGEYDLAARATDSAGVTSNVATLAVKVGAASPGQQPVAGSVPVVSGKARVGSTLTASAGVWTAGATVTYQWSAGGRVVAGATKRTFTPGAAQVGKAITVTVTGAKTGWVTTVRTSKVTAKVVKGSLVAKKVSVTGKAKVGKKLTVKTKGWGPGAVSLTYRWYVGGKKVKGKAGAKKALLVKKVYRGKKVTVKVTGKKAGYTTVTKKAKTKRISR